MTRLAVAFAGCLLLLCAAGQARAETGAASEVELEADRVEIDREAGVARFEGGVRVRHGDLEITCERLTADVDDAGAVRALVATGGVRIRAGEVTASAASARYEPGAGRLTLTGSARVRTAGSDLTGRSIAILLRQGRVTVEGARGVIRVQ